MKKALWFELDGDREFFTPFPSGALISEMIKLDPPAWKTETKREFLDRLALLLGMILGTATWKSTPANPHALPIEPNTLTFKEGRHIAIAVMAHVSGLDANLALDLQRVRDAAGNFSPGADDFTIGDLRRAADPLMPL